MIERSSAEDCTENIDKVKIAKKALLEHGNECVYSYTICVILAVIALTIGIGEGAYFVYKYMNHWYLKNDVTRVKFCTRTKKKNLVNLWMGKVKEIEIKNRT